MKPTLRNNAGIYVLEWPDQRLRIRIDKIHTDSRDNVWGEMLVQNTDPNSPTHISHGRQNLTSPTAKRSLTRELSEITGDLTVNWREVVEQACIETLEAYRLGEPVIEMNTVGPRQRPRWRVYPLWVEEHPNMLFGDGETGKSLLATLWAVLVSSGREHLGMEPLAGRVLYLDYEQTAEELRERITMIENGLNAPQCSDILYRFCYHPIASDIEQVQRIVSDNDVQFVIIDSFSVACGGDLVNPEQTTNYFRALRTLKATTLTVHHISKASAGLSRATPYGGVYIRNLVRSAWELRSVHEEGEPVVQMGLFHDKANFGERLKPIGLSANFKAAEVSFKHSDVKSVPQLSKAMGLPTQIADLLTAGALTVKEISDTLNVSANQVRARLSEGRDKRFTVVLEGKEPRWGLLIEED